MAKKENEQWTKIYTEDARAFLGHVHALERYVLLPLDLNTFLVEATIHTMAGKNTLSFSSAGRRFRFQKWSDDNKPEDHVKRAGKIYCSEMQGVLAISPTYTEYQDMSPTFFKFPDPPKWAPPPPIEELPHWKEGDQIEIGTKADPKDKWLEAAEEIENGIHLKEWKRPKPPKAAPRCITKTDIKAWHEFIPKEGDIEILEHFEGYSKGPDDPLKSPTGRFSSENKISLIDVMVMNAENRVRNQFKHLTDRERREKEEALDKKVQDLKHTAIFRTIDMMDKLLGNILPKEVFGEQIHETPGSGPWYLEGPSSHPREEMYPHQERNKPDTSRRKEMYPQQKEKTGTRNPTKENPKQQAVKRNLDLNMETRPRGEVEEHTKMYFDDTDKTMNKVEKKMQQMTRKELIRLIYNEDTETSSDESSVFEAEGATSQDIGPDRRMRRNTSIDEYDCYITDVICDLAVLNEEISHMRLGGTRLKRYIDHKIIELENLMKMMNSEIETAV